MAVMAPKRKLSATVVVLLLLSAAGWFGWSCLKLKQAESSAPADLAAMADLIFDQIARLESRKDVVCWSSFCKLDNFMAQKPHSPTAVLVKIHAMQVLTDRVWEKASLGAEGARVTRKDLTRVVRSGFDPSPASQIEG